MLVRSESLARAAAFLRSLLARETKGKTELLLVEDGNHVAHNRSYKDRGKSADWMASRWDEYYLSPQLS